MTTKSNSPTGEQETGELEPHKAINFLTALEHQARRNHEYRPNECGECSLTEAIVIRLRKQLGLTALGETK